MCIDCCYHLRSYGRVVTTSICCIPCPCEYSQTRVTRRCISEQVHSCTAAIISCCWSCKVWCSSTIYGRISTCFTNGWSVSVNCCDHLRSYCRMVTTSIRCIPCPCEYSQTRVTRCCISEQVHSCTTAVISCGWSCEVWCCRTIYGSIATCLTDCRSMCIDCCDHLRSYCRMVTTSICCIPCPCEYSQTRVTCCCISEQVHRCTTAIISCGWSREHWCCCTIYSSISTCFTNGWSMCIYCCDHLRSYCRMSTTGICCIPCPREYSQARVTRCCISEQVHSCTTAIISCCWSREVWCTCTIYSCIATCFTDCRGMSVDCCDHLCSYCRMVTTSIRCIPCPGEYSQTRVTRCCISEQVHSCTTAIISCCWSCEVWCSCTIYSSIATCFTNGWSVRGNCCDHLRSYCRMVTTGIRCIPCPCEYSQTRVTCCCISEQVQS